MTTRATHARTRSEESKTAGKPTLDGVVSLPYPPIGSSSVTQNQGK